MTRHPCAKINLGLHLQGKRQDGYHDILSALYPIPWQDSLSIAYANQFSFSRTGIPLSAPDTNNTCVQAYETLKRDHPLPPVRIRLEKRIPACAGLGGGSSDAATTLLMLKDMFQLSTNLSSVASSIGSDVPFFLQTQPTLVTGRGDPVLSLTSTLNLSGHHVLVVHVGLSFSTKDMYAAADSAAKTTKHMHEKAFVALLSDKSRWQRELINDFESIAFTRAPALKRVKNKLYQAGAWYASMSGSGSACYGLFHQKPPQSLFSEHTTYASVLV